MTIHLFKDEALTIPISEGDFSNPDQDSFNGTDGDSKDARLFLANEQTRFAEAVSESQTNVTLVEPRFSETEWIIAGNEQMRITAGQGTIELTVERGFSGTTPQTHGEGSKVFSALYYGDLTIEPIDANGTDESTWISLATTQEGLGDAVGGQSLLLGNKNHDETLVFWRRITVPPGTPVQNKTDLKLKISGLESPVS